MKKKQRKSAIIAVLLIVAILLSGCQSDAEPKAAITGNYTCTDVNCEITVELTDTSFRLGVKAEHIALSGAFRELNITDVKRTGKHTLLISTKGKMCEDFSYGYVELSGKAVRCDTPLFAEIEIDMSKTDIVIVGGLDIEGLAKKGAKSLITSGIKKIPYVGNIAAGALGPTINDILGIKEGPSTTDILSEIKDQIHDLSLQIDDATQDILNRLYLSESFNDFNKELTALATVTDSIYDRIDNIYGTDSSDDYKAIKIAEILDFSDTNIKNYVVTTKTLSKYLDSTQISNLKKTNLFENAYYACCSDSVLGGEAAMRASEYVNQVSGVLAYSYKAMITVLYSKMYVVENLERLEKNEAGDPDVANSLSSALASKYKDKANIKEWSDLLNDTSDSGIVALHNHYFSDEDENSIANQYNKFVQKHWFSFIRKYKVTDSDLEIEFVDINKKLFCVKPAEIGLERTVVKDATENVVNSVNNTLNDTLYTSLTKDEIKNLINHMAENKYNVFLSNETDENLLTTKDTLIEMLRSYGFETGSPSGKSLFICSSSGDYAKYSHYDTTPMARHLGDDYEAKLSVNAFDCEVETAYTTSTGVAKEIPEWKDVRYYYYQKKYNSSNVKRDDGTDYTFYYFAPADTEINSKADFAEFVTSVTNGNTYYNKTVNLNVDLDFDKEIYDYIWLQDKTNTPFRGTFNGNGHTISNVTDNSAYSCGGIFRNLGEGAYINRLNLNNINIKGSDSKSGFGALAGVVTGNVKIGNITLEHSTVSGGNCVGGLVGEVKSGSLVINDCDSHATVTAFGNYAGGIIGASSSKKSQNINLCQNFGNITALSGKAAGGIVGYLANDSADQAHIITFCKNSNSVTTSSGYTGGIIGHLDTDSNSHEIHNNTNSGEIKAGSSYAGGIVGFSEGGGNFTENINSGNIKGKIAGGIMGQNEDDSISFNGSENSGIITAENQAGGILGVTGSRSQDKKFSFDKCSNSGAVTSSSSHAGGIVAEVYTDNLEHSFDHCTNTANISGFRSSGGIVGKMEGGAKFSGCRNEGVISSSNADAAGIVGYVVDDGCSFVNCTNEGDISGKESSGGIAGEIGDKDNDRANTFTDCKNFGKVTADTLNAGGIVGMLKTDSTKHSFSGCSNTGEIAGHTTAGGIAGFMYGGGNIKNCSNSGSVTAQDYVGGMFGRIEDDTCNFSDCENTGVLSEGASHKGNTCGYDGKRKSTY